MKKWDIWLLLPFIGMAVGGILGYFWLASIAGNVVEAIAVGLVLGFSITTVITAMTVPERGPYRDPARVQSAFFTTVFSVMGHMAKADGRVNEDEIGMARAVMSQMNLTGEHRDMAIKLFRDGKHPAFPLDQVLDQFYNECRGQYELIQVFIEILLQAAYADGRVHPAERALLERVADRLHYPREVLARLEAMLAAQHRFYEEAVWEPATARGPTLDDAYAALGVSPSASDAEVKRAYRRLMSQHHPDRLVARGLPPEMIKVANEKTAEIKAAYERIRQARGIR